MPVSLSPGTSFDAADVDVGAPTDVDSPTACLRLLNLFLPGLAAPLPTLKLRLAQQGAAYVYHQGLCRREAPLPPTKRSHIRRSHQALVPSPASKLRSPLAQSEGDASP